MQELYLQNQQHFVISFSNGTSMCLFYTWQAMILFCLAGMVPDFPGCRSLSLLCALCNPPISLRLHSKSTVVMENLSMELFQKYIFRPSSAEVYKCVKIIVCQDTTIQRYSWSKLMPCWKQFNHSGAAVFQGHFCLLGPCVLALVHSSEKSGTFPEYSH